METNYKAGVYISCPCLKCGCKMQLKTNLQNLSSVDEAVIECRDCELERTYTVGEIKAIINSKY